MQVENLLRKPLGRIAAVERDAPCFAAHADVSARGDGRVKALKRRRAGRFEQHAVSYTHLMIPAYFKGRFGTNETLLTLMLNYVALYTIQALQQGPWLSLIHI